MYYPNRLLQINGLKRRKNGHFDVVLRLLYKVRFFFYKGKSINSKYLWGCLGFKLNQSQFLYQGTFSANGNRQNAPVFEVDCTAVFAF